jgi:hypothetical protein
LRISEIIRIVKDKDKNAKKMFFIQLKELENIIEKNKSIPSRLK